MQRRLDAPAVCSNCNQRRDLLTEGSGRRSLPPAPIRRHRRDGQWQYRGVSDHEIWPDLRSRPRPQKRSLTPRCLCLSRSRRSPRCDRRSPQRRAQSAPSLHRPSHSIVRFAVARSRRSALLRPRMRAAGGLDRAIREPLESNYRRPRVNLLTTRADGAIVEFSSTVAARNPLHIARCEAHESAASGHDSFLSRFTPWPPTRATTRPRSKRSERTALRPQAKAPDPSRLQIRHRHAATALRLSVVDASEPHSVLPIHSRTSTRNRHRRSTWAGVSWPNDDGIGASGGDNIDRTFARTRTTRSTRSVTSLCALSSERLPVRLRASCSRRNGRATPQRFIEARQHEGRHLRALLVGQPA